jgi:hypothetical protein
MWKYSGENTLGVWVIVIQSFFDYVQESQYLKLL